MVLNQILSYSGPLGNVTVITSLTGSALHRHKHVHTISDPDTSSVTMAVILKTSIQSQQPGFIYLLIRIDFSVCNFFQIRDFHSQSDV